MSKKGEKGLFLWSLLGLGLWVVQKRADKRAPKEWKMGPISNLVQR